MTATGARRVLRAWFAVTLWALAAFPARSLAADVTPEAAAALNRSRAVEAVQGAVRSRESTRRHRISSISVTEESAGSGPQDYQSLWNVTVRFWLDYSNPDEVPYVRGMMRRYEEVKDSASSNWLKWATAEIDRKREEYGQQISTVQESRERVLVSAQLDAEGGIIADSMELYYMAGWRIAVPVQDVIAAEPTEQASEQAGYETLGGKSPADSARVDAAQGPSTEAAPAAGSGQPQLLPGVATPPPVDVLGTDGTLMDSPITPARNRLIAMAGAGLLAALIFMAVVNQRLQALRRKSRQPDADERQYGEPGKLDQDARLQRMKEAVNRHYSQYRDAPGEAARSKRSTRP